MSEAPVPTPTQNASSVAERDEHLGNAVTTQQNDAERVRLQAQTESVVFQTRPLVSSRASAISLQSSIHICQTYTIICACVAASFNPGFRSMPGFYECDIPVAYMAVLEALRLFLWALPVSTRQRHRIKSWLFALLVIVVHVVVVALWTLTDYFDVGNAKLSLVSYLLPVDFVLVIYCLVLVVCQINGAVP